MKTYPVTTRLPGWLVKELRSHFRRSGEGPSGGLRRVAEEWWAMERFPAIEFRDTPFGRRAALRVGPEIWEIVMVWKEAGENLEALYDVFSWIPPEQLDQALAFYRRFRQPIDERIEENERVARFLEQELG